MQITFGKRSFAASMLGVLAATGFAFAAATPADATDSFLEHKGLVMARPAAGSTGMWAIGGKLFAANEQTVVESVLGVGSCAEVKYVRVEAGNRAVLIKGDDDCGMSLPFTPTLPFTRPHHDFSISLRDHGIVFTRPVDSNYGEWTIGENIYQSISGTTRVDDDRLLRLTHDDGPIEAGDCVEVRYVLSGTVRIATRIEGEDRDDCMRQRSRLAFGQIISLPASSDLTGDWNIGGKMYSVLTSTHLENDDFALGDLVKVKFSISGTMSEPVRTAIEIEKLIRIPRPEQERIKVRGLIESRPASTTVVGEWVIAGTSMTVTEAMTAMVKADLAVGDCVEAYYKRTDAGNMALKIKAEDDCDAQPHREQGRQYGLIRSMPLSSTEGIWIVAGRSISVTANTVISEAHGPAQVGAFVKVVFTKTHASNVKEAISITTLPLPEGGEKRCLGRISRIEKGSLARGEAAGTYVTVAGVRVLVTDATMIDEANGAMAQGKAVTLNAAIDPTTGALTATSVRTLNGISQVFLPAVGQ